MDSFIYTMVGLAIAIFFIFIGVIHTLYNFYHLKIYDNECRKRLLYLIITGVILFIIAFSYIL